MEGPDGNLVEMKEEANLYHFVQVRPESNLLTYYQQDAKLVSKMLFNNNKQMYDFSPFLVSSVKSSQKVA